MANFKVDASNTTKKMPKLTVKKMPVYSKVSGLDTTKKGGQERTNDYTVNSSRTDKFYEEAERRGVAKEPNFENLAAGGSAFKMKGFSGFGNSPLKKMNKKLVKQAADIRKKAEEIEVEFVENFKILTSNRKKKDSLEEQRKSMNKRNIIGNLNAQIKKKQKEEDAKNKQNN